MNEDQQLRLQAFFDGELPEKDAREVAAWVAREAPATDLLAELRNTRQALAGFEPGLKLPESREFYWSKIEREIRRLEPLPSVTRSASVFTLLRRFLVPASAVAALVLIATVAGLQWGRFGVSAAPETEMMSADAATFTYQDDANGTTLVWLSYPAEREFAQKSIH